MLRFCICLTSERGGFCTYLLWVPQVKKVQVALVTHLLVCGEHDDVSAEVKSTRPDGRAGVEQSQLFTCEQETIRFNLSS